MFQLSFILFLEVYKVSLHFKKMMPDTIIRSNTDVVLIGAGIMSATLGLMLKD
jgi:hypothetical protein